MIEVHPDVMSLQRFSLPQYGWQTLPAAAGRMAPGVGIYLYVLGPLHPSFLANLPRRRQ